MTNEKKRREKDLIFGAVQIYPENWRNWVSDGRCFSHGKGERAHSIGLTRGRGEKRGNWAGFRATKFDEEKGGERERRGWCGPASATQQATRSAGKDGST